jgi:glycosyltransferase involved in cell wall biosynthesis
MSLLYFHSPLPPAETGIADYAFEILARLKNHFDIVIADDGGCRAAADALLLPTIPVEVWRDLRQRSARGIDIYHLGNNGFHTGILQRALGHPGLCAIHDASLTGLLLSSPKLWPAFRRFAEYDLGVHADRFIEARERFEIFGWQDFLVRNLGLVADSALGVVVHSKYVESLISRRHRPRHLFRLNHHLAEQFRTREGAAIADPRVADFLRDNASRVKVATFGFLTPPKRIDWLVEATRRACAAGADIALILGGKPHPDSKIPEVIRSGARDAVLHRLAGEADPTGRTDCHTGGPRRADWRRVAGQRAGCCGRRGMPGGICVSLVIDPHRDKLSKRRNRAQDQELDRGRVRKAALVVGSVDLQVCNIDYVLEELGIERFDVLLFVLLPMTVMSRPVVTGERAFDDRAPNCLRERGNAAASVRVAPRALAYGEIASAEISCEEIEVPLRIIACEALT